MSAIWGLVNREAKDVSDYSQLMDQSMQKYKIDRVEKIDRPGAHLACGHQYITQEAEGDRSPIYDVERGVIFAADCFLYNREMVWEKLQKERQDKFVQDRELNTIGDAELAYMAYCVWEEDFVNHLRGSFSIAIFCEKGQHLDLYVDQLARRYLAYCITDEFVSFGTVYSPIKSCLGKKIELNKKCIAEMYIDVSPLSFRRPSETVYKGIYHVNCGSHLTIDVKTGVKEERVYWSLPKNLKEIKCKSDEEYGELFVQYYEKCVKMLLRSQKETGIKLSGGLDSSSVAAFAAPILCTRGKKLHSYTSVPATDFEYRNDSYITENEKDNVLAQKEMYPNIEPHFFNGDKGNCFTRLEQYQRDYEGPVKPAGNIDNVAQMSNMSASDGCKILLSGSNGNASISYGDVNTYVYWKIKGGHFIQAYRECAAYCRFERYSRKEFAKSFLKALFRKVDISKFLRTCYLTSDNMEKYEIVDLAKVIYGTAGNGCFQTREQRYNFIYAPIRFQHMGYYETHTSLLYGVFALDPTLTVEMIEFCMRLPIDCYVRGGRQRRAIRDYMSEKLPFVVTSETVGRGVQSPDFACRVNRDWDGIKNSVREALEEPTLREYIKEEEIASLLEYIDNHEYHFDKSITIQMAVIASLGYFLKTFKNEIGD